MLLKVEQDMREMIILGIKLDIEYNQLLIVLSTLGGLTVNFSGAIVKD